MRAQREKVKMLQAGGADPDEVMLAKCKYQAQLDEYGRFSKKMGLKQERERIYLDMQGRVALENGQQKSVEAWLEKLYNKGDLLENIRIYEADSKLRSRIKSGVISTTINAEKQARHIIGNKGYVEGRSYLIISENELQSLVSRYAGTGKFQRDRNDRWKNTERIVADQIIGMNVNRDTREETETNQFYIHYSKTGVHVVPTYPKEE